MYHWSWLYIGYNIGHIGIGSVIGCIVRTIGCIIGHDCILVIILAIFELVQLLVVFFGQLVIVLVKWMIVKQGRWIGHIIGRVHKDWSYVWSYVNIGRDLVIYIIGYIMVIVLVIFWPYYWSWSRFLGHIPQGNSYYWSYHIC